MKIAIIRQRYNPYGGAERFVERALGALVAEGVTVDLITRNWDGAPAAGFSQISCDPPYARWWGGRAARDRSFAQAAQALMAAGGYDITQSHERIPGCMIFRAGDGVHAAWLAHRSRQLSPLERLAQNCSPYHRYVLEAERRMFAHPALRAVICNSAMVAEEIRHHYGLAPDRLQVIHNGVDTAFFHPERAAALRQEARARLELDPGTPLLLFVGSGFARKGVPGLLQALARMQRQDAQLLIVGADRKLNAMQRLAARLGLAQRVRFAGPQREVLPWYGAADGFVLPTLYDPGPNAALEALACGLPLVTSLRCGAREWVQEGVNGWVTDALDVPALARALDGLCELGFQAPARAAARAAVAGLSLEAMSARLVQLYRALVPQAPRV